MNFSFFNLKNNKKIFQIAKKKKKKKISNNNIHFYFAKIFLQKSDAFVMFITIKKDVIILMKQRKHRK